LLRRVFGALRQHWRGFGLYALIYTCASYAIYAPLKPYFSESWGFGLLDWAFQLLLLQPFLKVPCVWTMWADFREKASNPGAALLAVGRQAPALLLTNAMVIACALLGLVALVVPGVIAVVALATSNHACIVERLDPWRSLRRGLDLTRGQRWRVLAFILMVLAIEFGLVAVVAVLWGATGGFGLASLVSRSSLTLIAFMIGGVQVMLMGVFVGACDGALYVELRRLKDGAGPQATAELFA
jgi:hypothetical protein